MEHGGRGARVTAAAASVRRHRTARAPLRSVRLAPAGSKVAVVYHARSNGRAGPRSLFVLLWLVRACKSHSPTGIRVHAMQGAPCLSFPRHVAMVCSPRVCLHDIVFLLPTLRVSFLHARRPMSASALKPFKRLYFKYPNASTGRDDGPSTVPPYKPPRAACGRGVRAGDGRGSPAFLVLRRYLPFFCFLCPGSLVYSALHTRPSAPGRAPTRAPAASPGRSPAALWYSPADPTRACACGLVNLLVAVPLWTAAPPPLQRAHANAFAFLSLLCRGHARAHAPCRLRGLASWRPRPTWSPRPSASPPAPTFGLGGLAAAPPPHTNSRHPPPPALPHPRSP